MDRKKEKRTEKANKHREWTDRKTNKKTDILIKIRNVWRTV